MCFICGEEKVEFIQLCQDSKDGAIDELSESGESGQEVLNERSEFRNLTSNLINPVFSAQIRVSLFTLRKNLIY